MQAHNNDPNSPTPKLPPRPPSHKQLQQHNGHDVGKYDDEDDDDDKDAGYDDENEYGQSPRYDSPTSRPSSTYSTALPSSTMHQYQRERAEGLQPPTVIGVEMAESSHNDFNQNQTKNQNLNPILLNPPNQLQLPSRSFSRTPPVIPPRNHSKSRSRNDSVENTGNNQQRGSQRDGNQSRPSSQRDDGTVNPSKNHDNTSGISKNYDDKLPPYQKYDYDDYKANHDDDYKDPYQRDQYKANNDIGMKKNHHDNNGDNVKKNTNTSNNDDVLIAIPIITHTSSNTSQGDTQGAKKAKDIDTTITTHDNHIKGLNDKNNKDPQDSSHNKTTRSRLYSQNHSSSGNINTSSLREGDDDIEKSVIMIETVPVDLNEDQKVSKRVQNASELAVPHSWQVFYPFLYLVLCAGAALPALIPGWEKGTITKYKVLRPLLLTSLALSFIMFVSTIVHSLWLLVSGRSRWHNSRKTKTTAKKVWVWGSLAMTSLIAVFFVVPFLIMISNFDEFHKVVNLLSAIIWWCSYVIVAPILVWMLSRCVYDLIQMMRRPPAVVVLRQQAPVVVT